MIEPDREAPNNPQDLAEAELQQELRSMFEIDTQKYLQDYLDLVEQLRSSSWKTDILSIYRSIHTIKGGAITVRAEGILQVATLLEDLLCDLCYLDPPPPLKDGQLKKILVEAAELLASTISPTESDITPTLERIQALHQQIEEKYLPEDQEKRQIHQEFAQNGLDLVVLDLEIAGENLPDTGTIPPEVMKIALEIFAELEQIGREIQLSSGWQELLIQARELFARLDNNFWRSNLPQIFTALKNSAKEGGKSIDLEWIFPTCTSQFNALDNSLNWLEDLDLTEIEREEDPNGELDFVPSLLDDEYLDLFEDEPEVEIEQVAQLTEITPQIPTKIADAKAIETITNRLAPSPIFKNNIPVEKVQIPVPLERLDRSAEYLIETLLSARATQNFYNTIQNQLVQLISLAKEGVEQIGNLRQLQKDYARLRDRNTLETDELTLDRYRQGNNTINRLLEMNLRLSELGAEAERTVQQTADSLSILEDNVLKLQSTVEESRLVPFQNLAFRARIILRDLTNRYGKPAELIVKGEEIELEVGVARALEPALLHLIRNAYAHGLESVEKRMQLRKPPQGTIYLTLSRHGNSFQLELQDDGGGIDAAAVQAKAEAKGLPLTNAKNMGSILAVICQPGFSSSDEISDLCGRGVGMDVVKEQIESIGGNLSLETILGEGTSFRLEFPVPYLLVPCIKIRSSDRYFAIPTENISTTAIFADLKISKIESSKYAYSYIIQGEKAQKPGFDLLQYWQPSAKFRSFDETAICIYVPSQTEPNNGIWLLADELLDRSDLSIDPLPHPIVPTVGLMGVSLQSDGTLIPVIEVSILAEYLLNYPLKFQVFPEPEAIAKEASCNKILIVDDAALMRRRIQASLNTYGYVTHTCADGREAWNWISNNPNPALIVTDIDMPNMDGFTLTSQCRKAGIKTPILIISSRVAEEWSKEAFRLGATEYMTKGFSTSDLINKIKSLLGD